MEELLKSNQVPVSKRVALFAKIRLAVYFSDPEKRLKCIKARLQAISALCKFFSHQLIISVLGYTFEFDERLIYHGLFDELVDVLQIPDGEVMSIKACALRTMTAIFNFQRSNIKYAIYLFCVPYSWKIFIREYFYYSLGNILESTGMTNFHGVLPTRIRRWIQGMVDGTCDASGGTVNQQYTIALLSFLYHLAALEQTLGSGKFTEFLCVTWRKVSIFLFLIFHHQCMVLITVLILFPVMRDLNSAYAGNFATINGVYANFSHCVCLIVLSPFPFLFPSL